MRADSFFRRRKYAKEATNDTNFVLSTHKLLDGSLVMSTDRLLKASAIAIIAASPKFLQ